MGVLKRSVILSYRSRGKGGGFLNFVSNSPTPHCDGIDDLPIPFNAEFRKYGRGEAPWSSLGVVRGLFDLVQGEICRCRNIIV